MNNKKCDTCQNDNADRNCVDCSKFFCKTCFISEHAQLQYHTVKDIKNNAYIKDSNFRNTSFNNDIQLLPSDDLFSICDKSPSLDKEEDKYNSVYTSLNIGRRFLFETNKINEYESASYLSQALELEEGIKLNIVTFIGKPNKANEYVANSLLMKETPYKFPVCSESTLLCRVACDDSMKLLVLHTENMHKSIPDKTIDQTNMLRLLLSLSDAIVFTQTVPEDPKGQRSSSTRDFLRMHDIMELCRKEFGANYSRINKKEYHKLAPGLIYLVHSEFDSNKSLSELIVDRTGRKSLFQSFSKVLYYDGHDDQMFHYGLNQILQNLSEYRTKHSLEDICSCINVCKQSIETDNTDPFIPKIPNEWFICRQSCLICHAICTQPFEHLDAHNNDSSCNETEENKVYYCKKCIKENSLIKSTPLVFKAKGKEEKFLSSAVWYTFRGKVIECVKHGIIKDSNWFVNYYDNTVEIKCIHKWPGSSLKSQNAYPMGQMIVDRLTQVSKPINKILINSANTITDKFINPETWDSTNSAIECRCCKNSFTTTMSKHHCRSCGVVICTSCVVNTQSPVICNSCDESKKQECPTQDPTGLVIVKLVSSPLKVVSSFVRKTVTSINRPAYWEPDEKAIRCFICNQEFNSEMRPIHHCRACGKCVCDECSPQERPVDGRYLHEPSRICNTCVNNEYWKNGP